MLDYYLKHAEQETHISFDREERIAHICTSDRTQFTKLDRLCKEQPNEYKCVWVDSQILADGMPMSKKYTAPAKLIRFGRPREVTDEQREAMRERGKANAERLREYRQNSK